MSDVRSDGGRKILLAICLANLTYAFASSMLGSSLPAIITSLSLDSWGVGAIASAGAIGFFSVIPGGALADRRGKREPMLIGLLVAMLGYLLAGSSYAFQPLLMGLVLFGVGAGFWEVGVSAFIPDTFKGNPSGPMNVLHSMWGIGGFLGPLLVALAISTFRDWHQSFLIAAALLATTPAAILTINEGGRRVIDPTHHPIHTISSLPKGAVMALALEWGVELSINSYLPLLLESERGFGALDASTCLGIMLLMVAAGRIGWSKLIARIGVINTVRASAIMAGLSISMVALTGGPFTFLSILSTGFFISSLAPTILAYIGDRMPSSSAGMAIGLTLAAASMGGATIPASAALIAGRTKMSIAFIYLGALLLPIFLLMNYPLAGSKGTASSPTADRRERK